MSELSDDLAQWPDDPFAILGLPRRTNAADAKRAYTKLLRRFKPERLPEHFQKLREAYERVQSLLEYSFYYNHEDDDAPPERESSPSEPSENPTSSSASDPDERSSLPRIIHAPDPPQKVVSPGEAAWEKAIAGDQRTAYVLLRKAVEHDQAEIPEERGADYARLYWLETLFPDLSQKKPPARWVVIGLMRTKYHEALLELLRREAERQPLYALGKELAELLSRGSSRTAVPLALIRFQAAAQLDREPTIREDFQALQRTLALDSPQVWEYICEEAVRHALRTTTYDEAFWNSVRDDIARNEFGNDYRWERLEWMTIARDASRYHPPGFEHWLTLLRCSFVPEGKAFDEALAECVHRLALNPLATFDFFEALEQREQPAAAWLLQTLTIYLRRRNVKLQPRSPESEPILPPAWREFAFQQYATYRRELLKFSLYEMLEPEAALAFLQKRCNLLPTEDLSQDRVLLTIAAVYHAFWSPRGEEEVSQD